MSQDKIYSIERNYDIEKRELRGLLKALKKTRFWLYTIYFTIKLNVYTLITQLNLLASNLSKALIKQQSNNEIKILCVNKLTEKHDSLFADALTGFAKVLHLEYPKISCHIIDIENIKEFNILKKQLIFFHMG